MDEWTRKFSVCNEGLTVAWKNLSVITSETQSRFFSCSVVKRKEIIHGVSGAARPGALVAILGPSGSGKSTLMTVLANRNSGNLQVKGTITIGGKRKGEGNFVKYVSGFVYQEDLFLPSLTVREHLNFTAELRLGRNITEKARKFLIEDILNLLGLMKVADCRIGQVLFNNSKMNLSGGERKRLSIAAELITDPALLFCDEPTSGLDSFTALNLTIHLKSLAMLKNKTIICSIHQPSAQIFGLFHQIILLCQGRIAFNGTSEEAVAFFEQQGYKCNEDENPANYLIKSLAQEVISKGRIDEFCAKYEGSDYYKNFRNFINLEMNRDTHHESVIHYKLTDAPSWFSKLVTSTRRALVAQSRDLSVQKIRFLQKIAIGILIGLCLHGTVTWTQKGLTALKGVIFVTVTQNFFPPVTVTLRTLPERMTLFYREYSNNISTPAIFYLSNVITLLPSFIIDPVCFTIIIFWLTEITRSFFSLFISCVIITLVMNTSAAFGMMMSLLCRKSDVVLMIVHPIEIIFITCSGIFLKLSTLPWILKWVRHISWFTFAIEAIFIVQVDNVTNITCEDPRVPCIENGDDVLSRYDFNASNFWTDVLKIAMIYIIFHISAYRLLLMKLKKRTSLL